jgi:hypothetical protein
VKKKNPTAEARKARAKNSSKKRLSGIAKKAVAAREAKSDKRGRI